MAYEAVYEYADEDSSTYHEYQLTYEAVRDGDEEIETEIPTYTKITWNEWNQVSTEDGDGNGNERMIDPIECTVDESFSVKITGEEVKLLKDENGEIRYEKVFQWCLPWFGDDDESTGDKVIIGSHVARFYGACRSRMNNGGHSMEQIFSTREILKAY
jgi:hypothetical protein